VKKKILLYVGNHHISNVGIQDYIQTLRSLFANTGYVLTMSTRIQNLFLRDFYAVIFIEEFSTTAKLSQSSLFLRKFKGKKILILTEFINDKKETLNSFENILQNEYSFYLKIKKLINLSSKYFVLNIILCSLSYLLELIITLRSFILQRIPGFFFRILIIIPILLFFPIINLYQKTKLIDLVRYLAVKFRKIRFKGDKKWKRMIRLGKTEKDFDQYKEEIYMKTRYLGLVNIINDFDIILTSHDNISPNKLLKRNIPVERIYFSLQNQKIEIDNKKKIKLSFSGYLNKYRYDVLNSLCKDKNKFFDYEEIDEIIKYSKPRFIKKKYAGKNICSIHIKKSIEWPFSSPTRYINSINKNEIPLILENFQDKESTLLTLKKNILMINNWNELEKEIKELNMRLEEYKLILQKNEQSIEKII